MREIKLRVRRGIVKDETWLSVELDLATSTPGVCSARNHYVKHQPNSGPPPRGLGNPMWDAAQECGWTTRKRLIGHVTLAAIGTNGARRHRRPRRLTRVVRGLPCPNCHLPVPRPELRLLPRTNPIVEIPRANNVPYSAQRPSRAFSGRQSAPGEAGTDQ